MKENIFETSIDKLADLVKSAKTILVLQPDSPDGDSFGTALGLEEILGDLGKIVVMYSYKQAETYLRVHEGWDRVLQDFPKAFDLTVLVDTGSPKLIKETLAHHSLALLAKPFVVIDHHVSRQDFGFPVIEIVDESVATAELVTQICLQHDWPINQSAATKLTRAIMSDSLNLTVSGTRAASVRMLAELVERGANLHEIYQSYRETSALTPEQVHLKGQLLQSISFVAGGELAIAEITPEIVAANNDKFEPYNMIISEMQWASGVKVSAVFKNYGTKINVPMRSRDGLAGPLAESLGGGGHPNAGAYRCETTDITSEKLKLINAYQDFMASRQAKDIEVNDETL